MSDSASLTVAVVSHEWAGHIPAYHRLYVQKFREQGCRVVEASPGPRPGLALRLWRRLGRALQPAGARWWQEVAAQVREAERASGCAVDAVFIVYLDWALRQDGLPGESVPRYFPWPWAGVVNGPAAVRGTSGAFPGGERALAAPNCRAVVVTDDEFLPACAATWPGRRVLAMPEVAALDAPGQPAALAGLQRQIQGRRLVGLLGVVTAKKNVAGFVALARLAEKTRPDLRFCLAGDFSADACPAAERAQLAAVIEARPGNCFVFPDPIPDGAEFNAWVAACDAVWVAYRDTPYKSNVLTKAAHFRKPVLVSPGGVMATHVARHRLGAVVNADDAAATLAALGELLDAPATGRDFAGFSARNAPEALDATVRELREAFRS
jgi:glycosyltransferase involved in cell wall biosynthesis